jgi:hypothetical protein
MSSKPIVIFDTSAINRAVERRETAEPIIAGLKSGFWLRVTGTNVEEIVATEAREQRELLLNMCQKLMTAGEIIKPFHWIIESMILAFERGSFEWRRVPIRALAYEREVAFREIINDALSKEEQEEADRLEDSFEKVYSDARPSFDRIFENEPDSRPSSVADLVSRFKVKGGAFWSFGIGLFEKKAGRSPDEETIRRFVNLCPPFHTLLLALCVAQYHRCIATKEEREKLEKKRAKRNDLFSAVYLPFCDEFISDDRDQLRCLREVVSLGSLNTKVLWYNQLDERLSGKLGTLASKGIAKS